MNRRNFIIGTSGVALTAFNTPLFAQAAGDKMDRIALGTVLYRNRFKQTKAREIERIENELTLLQIPEYFKSRFGIRNIEFWSNHFESREEAYLKELRGKIQSAGCTLVNVQIDDEYDLAAKDEAKRLEYVAHAKQWIDAVALLGSKCIRLNPGRANGSVEQSIKSMKEVNRYAKERGLIMLTENHFGLEMNPEVHLRIVEESGPDNIYTLPDFGNYPDKTRYESLEKILPKAYFISAKVIEFDKDMNHTSFDFDRCVKMAEAAGFKGIYSVEQWGPKYQPLDEEKVAEWLIEHVKANI